MNKLLKALTFIIFLMFDRHFANDGSKPTIVWV